MRDEDQWLGSKTALRYGFRDLPTLNMAIQRCRRTRVAVQAGGNLGIFPHRLAEVFETVYTFEPSHDVFLMLCENAPDRNIIRFQAALGDSRQGVSVSMSRWDSESPKRAHEGVTHITGGGRIPQIRVDDLELTDVDLIQLDLEGWEPFALIGAEKTIRQQRPVLMVEINRHCRNVGTTEDEVRAAIISLGYRFVIRVESDEIYEPV